jgi:hypothetical protein
MKLSNTRVLQIGDVIQEGDLFRKTTCTIKGRHVSCWVVTNLAGTRITVYGSYRRPFNKYRYGGDSEN